MKHLSEHHEKRQRAKVVQEGKALHGGASGAVLFPIRRRWVFGKLDGQPLSVVVPHMKR